MVKRYHLLCDLLCDLLKKFTFEDVLKGSAVNVAAVVKKQNERLEIMDLKKYQELALKTENKDLNFESRLMNCALGLSGEFGEISELFKKCFFHKHPIEYKKFQDELGDLLWYTMVLADVIGIDIDDNMQELCYGDPMTAKNKFSPDSTLFILLLNINKRIGDISDHIIRGVFLNEKVIYKNQRKWIVQIVSSIKKICEVFGQFEFEEVMEGNIKKLKGRYPEGFSSEASINRTK